MGGKRKRFFQGLNLDAVLLFALLIVGGSLWGGCKRENESEKRDAGAIKYKEYQLDNSKPWVYWSCGGGYFCFSVLKRELKGMNDNPPVIYRAYKWSKDNLSILSELPPTDFLHGVWVSDTKYIGDFFLAKNQLLLKDAVTGKTERNWDIPEDWWNPGRIAISGNGKYMALDIAEISTYHRSGDDPYGVIRHSFGVLELETGKLEWCGKYCLGTDGPDYLRSISISDDGRYIAYGGWNNGVGVVDVKQQKMIWHDRPDREVFNEAFITPKGDVVYAGGRSGCLYGISTQTGKVLSRWWITPSEKDEKKGLWEVCRVSVSPNGKYVAAAAALGKGVSVWRADTGKRIGLFGNSGVLLMQFSPDSKYLATMQPGDYQIAEMPE